MTREREQQLVHERRGKTGYPPLSRSLPLSPRTSSIPALFFFFLLFLKLLYVYRNFRCHQKHDYIIIGDYKHTDIFSAIEMLEILHYILKTLVLVQLILVFGFHEASVRKIPKI